MRKWWKKKLLLDVDQVSMLRVSGVKKRNLEVPVTMGRSYDTTDVSNALINRQENLRDFQVSQTGLAKLRVQRVGVPHVRAVVIDQILPLLLHIAPRRTVLLNVTSIEQRSPPLYRERKWERKWERRFNQKIRYLREANVGTAIVPHTNRVTSFLQRVFQTR